MTMPNIEIYSRSTTPTIGVSAEDIEGQLGNYFGAPDGEGVLVTDVESGSPRGKIWNESWRRGDQGCRRTRAKPERDAGQIAREARRQNSAGDGAAARKRTESDRGADET